MDGEKMTKEEFLAGVQDLVQDMADPNGEYAVMASEGEEISNEIRQFDPVMADKLLAITTSIRDFGQYVQSRAEFLGASSPKGV
jgi:hypothetical protein